MKPIYRVQYGPDALNHAQMLRVMVNFCLSIGRTLKMFMMETGIDLCKVGYIGLVQGANILCGFLFITCYAHPVCFWIDLTTYIL